MKVLHVINRYPPAVGGAETWCREVCQHLVSAGDSVKVLTLDVIEEEEYWRDPPLEQCTRRLGRLDWDEGVCVRRYRRSLPVHLLYHLFFKLILDRILHIYFYGPHSVEMYGRIFAEVKAADVVHLHTVPHPHNFIGYFAARLCRKRVVITPHFHPGHPHYELWSIYWLLKRCDAVIAVSEYERDYLIRKGIDAGKIVVTGNGVRLEDYVAKDPLGFKAELFRKYQLSEATKIVLFLGRKREYKGIDTLVKAFRQLAPRSDSALFLVGPSSCWFEDFYRQLPPQDRQRVIDLGSISHEAKVNLLHMADVLVLPSRFEAFGIVFLEAWTCGTPVIGASTGAIPSVVGNAGFTFEYGNAQELAEKIEVVLDNEALAYEMALNGRKRIAEHYTWAKIGVATRKTYLPEGVERMRILICSNLFPPHVLGGAELVAYKQAKIFKELGYEVRIFSGRLGNILARRYHTKIEEDEFHTTWVNLSPRDISGESWDFHNEKIGQAFAKVLEVFSPYVVHFHNLVGLSMRMIDECRQRHIPTVLTLHDYWGICFKNTMTKNDGSVCMQGGFDCLGCKDALLTDPPLPSPARNSHLLLSLSKVDRFIAPSRYLAERYAANGLPRERISVIRNGVDVAAFNAARKGNKTMLTLGFVGYLGKHKGLEILLRALALFKDIERVRLLVVGDGEEAAYLKSLCRELALDQYVTFYGYLDGQQIPAVYEKIDVIIVPSIWPETSSLVVAEAMASGLPVIASDVGAIGELVENGVTGFLVPPKDSSALAERIERLLAHPELLSAMGQKGHAKIQMYSLKENVNRVIELYQRMSDQGMTERLLDGDVLLYDAEQPWSLSVRDMFHQLTGIEKKLRRRLLVCSASLADDEALKLARLLLIPSVGQNSFLYALQALRRRLPIIVHAGALELKELCLASNAGLSYADPEELRECLELLLSNERLRQAMGANGRKFIESVGMSSMPV